MNTSDMSENSQKVYSESIVWESLVSWASMERVNADRELKKKVIPNYLKSGVTQVCLTVGGDYSDLDQTIRWIASERRFLKENHSDICFLATKASDIIEAKKAGKVAITFNMQGTKPLQGAGAQEDPGDINLVQLLYDLGVRQALLAHNMRNYAADGCHEPGESIGLSHWGVRMVQEMNRVGMTVDMTHTGYKSTMHAIEISTKPVIFSHSNPRNVFDHPRNIRDDQIKACAATGGVIGACGWGPIINARNDASAEEICKHIMYLVELVGPEHVGIGLDYVYAPELTTARLQRQPQLYGAGGDMSKFNYSMELMDFAQPEDFPQIANILLSNGLAENEVQGILGNNMFRVASANWV
jgi:membrane dipeptidase